jgi:hypothetical protein
VAVSTAAVVTAAQEVTTRPLQVVRVDLGQHVRVIELRLHPVGVDQHISRAHGEAFLSGHFPFNLLL